MPNWLTRLGNQSIRRTNIVLVVLGCASLVIYRVGLRASGTTDIKWFIKLTLAQSAIFLTAACLVLCAKHSRSTFFLIVAFAILFRLAILLSPPYLSDDIYRYIWDGRVQAAGINPYRYVPAAPELAHLRDNDIYPEINRRDHAHTIYPPVAQVLFLLTTRVSESVTWMKLTILGFEIVAAWAIAQLLISFGMSTQRLFFYAWHPLVVWEFAGSGHVDAVVVAFVALAFLASHKRADMAAGFALAGATLVKLFPIVLFPAVYRRWDWKMPLAFVLTILVAYSLYLSVGPRVMGYLPGYAKEEGLISGERFYALSLANRLFDANIPTVAYLLFALLVMAAIAVWSLFQKGEFERIKLGMILATAATVLFAPHYSWYFAWLVPFLCFVPLVSLFYLTAVSFVLYGSWLGDSPAEMFRLNSYLYLPAVLIALVEFLIRRWSLQPVLLNKWVTNKTIDNREG